MTRVITYFTIIGYEEDGTEEYGVAEWKCSSEEEFRYALDCIDDEDIFDIK